MSLPYTLYGLSLSIKVPPLYINYFYFRLHSLSHSMFQFLLLVNGEGPLHFFSEESLYSDSLIPSCRKGVIPRVRPPCPLTPYKTWGSLTHTPCVSPKIPNPPFSLVPV